MEDMGFVEELVRKIAENPVYLVFCATWILGYMLKNHTRLNNNIIPWALTVFGCTMGFFFIEMTVVGVVSGAAIVYSQIGVYEGFKSARKLTSKE